MNIKWEDIKLFASRQRKLLIILVVALFVTAVGLTYAIYQQINKNTSNQVIQTGEFVVTLDKSAQITSDLAPLTDEEGLATAGYGFTVRNTGTINASYKLILQNNPAEEAANILNHQYLKYSLNGSAPQILNTLPVDGTNYVLDVTGLDSGATKEYNLKIWVAETVPLSDINKKINLILNITAYVSTDTLTDSILAANGGHDAIVAKAAPNYAVASLSEDTGLYSIQDDKGTAYYFRGNKAELNNNVVFANHQWKITRINGDGSIRLIYNGPCAENSCAILDGGAESVISAGAFNIEATDKKFLGYKYDSTVSSNAKTVLETWYNDNLLSVDSKISDSVFCNDLSGEAVSSLNAAQSGYDVTFRLTPSNSYTEITPKLTCADESIYRKVDGDLNQKVGLITADELVLAGISSTATSNNYLYNNVNYWTMSPAYHEANVPYGTIVKADGSSGSIVINDATVSLRPVINLKASVSFTGNGTAASPYIIK